MEKLFTTIALLAAFALPVLASFTSATVVELKQVRDTVGAVTGVYFVLVIRDDTTTEWTECKYLITGDEFASLPAGAAAKRTALVAIAKREAHTCHTKWIADLLLRAQPPVIRDPITDLGVNSFVSFDGEAPPLPTPTPIPTP